MYIGHKQGIYGLCGALLSLAVFAFSSYPLQFPAFVSALIILVLACGIRVLPLEKVWPRILFTVLLLIGSYGCFCKYQQKSKTVEACKQWTKSRMFYHSGAYRQAVESYAEIQKEMKGNARFMFAVSYTHLYLALLVMDSFPVISDTGEMARVNILASMMSLLIRKVKF